MEAKTAADYLVKSSKAPTPLMETVGQCFHEIATSSTSAEARAAISNLKIVSVKEVEVEETSKKALVIVVPYIAFKNQVKPNHSRCVAEIEKKCKRHVVIIAHRVVLGKGIKPIGNRIRPRSRCLTEVQKETLQDMVGSVDIVGKRVVHQADGQRINKVYLDLKDKDNLEEKLPTFAAVYRTLFSRKAVFEFPEYVL